MDAWWQEKTRIGRGRGYKVSLVKTIDPKWTGIGVYVVIGIRYHNNNDDQTMAVSKVIVLVNNNHSVLGTGLEVGYEVVWVKRRKGD